MQSSAWFLSLFASAFFILLSRSYASEHARLPPVESASQPYIEDLPPGSPNTRLIIEHEGRLYSVESILPTQGPIVLRERATQFDGVIVDSPISVPAGVDGGMTVYRSQFLLNPPQMLPAPSEPNDLFYSQMNPDQERLGLAWSPFATVGLAGDVSPYKDLWTRLKASPNFGMAFDTGVANPQFDVRTIALGQPQGAGQTRFTGGEFLEDVPLFLISDTQLRDVGIGGAGADQIQFYIEANNHEETGRLDLSHAFTRVYAVENWTLGAGKTFSLFSYGGLAPATINQRTVLIGTSDLGDNEPVQLRVQRAPMPGGWGAGIAVEDPYVDDFEIPQNAVILTRWPTLAGNIRYGGTNEVDIFQIGGLMRTLGFEEQNGTEQFETAWAISVYGFKATHLRTDALGGVFFGIGGGDGVGQYIRGVSTSAVYDAGEFSTLKGLGGYVGYQYQWLAFGNREFGANAAYGYASMQEQASMPGDTNTELHHAWVNFLYYPTPNVATGIEYQYGERETIASGNGEDHRFMFVVSVAVGADPIPKRGANGFLKRSSTTEEGGRYPEPSSRISRQRL